MTAIETTTSSAPFDIAAAAADAKAASRRVATLSTDAKNALLRDLADRVDARRAEILEANDADMAASEAGGLPGPKLKRLKLTETSLDQLSAGVRQIADLPDPIGQITRESTVPSGLRVTKRRTPLGVIAMIYEARPGVTIDAFALCFKAGNAAILKGGKEADRSNRCLAAIAREALRAHGMPEAAITAFISSDREELKRMLQLADSIDLVIPRGGEPLIRFVAEHSAIPTIQHYHGVCHAYIDKAADLDMALEIVATGKTSAPATCNALECVLIHEGVAGAFVPALVARCRADGIELRADERVRARAGAEPVTPASDDDWGTEYLDLILAARVVESFDAALDHLAEYSSGHTDTIVTQDPDTAERFCSAVDSSCTLVNASTRFNDGFQLGLGAEIGISTTKIHAYGPMGLEELTTQRFVVHGTGQVR
ncbi:MAG: glutamate-5-semialdehyde dehydrogenase [Planctomycetota bacterium]